ncbi:Protein DENND6B [Halotydeus destructor]|nr:Protein DENND6B [Halotydeus destructor]
MPAQTETEQLPAVELQLNPVSWLRQSAFYAMDSEIKAIAANCVTPSQHGDTKILERPLSLRCSRSCIGLDNQGLENIVDSAPTSPRRNLVSDLNCDEPFSLPWDNFSKWCYCVCVVTFDIELGQAIESTYPPHVNLTEREKSNICYLAFPDSNSGCMGDTQFHFRTRVCPIRRKGISVYKEYNKSCLTSLEADSAYFYGYVYFRQIKDRTARRGYFQKSLVLLSRLPFVTLFTSAVSVLALRFFEEGESSLKEACADIDQWPPPVPGSNVQLPLSGISIQVHIPHRYEKLSTSPTTTPLNEKPPSSRRPSSELFIDSLPQQQQLPSIILPSVSEQNLFNSFLPIMTHIQTLWELALTCEPVVVMAPTPDISCEVVQSLVATIWPLKYASDYRPFFTIHDSEFEKYTTKNQAPPPVILGVTNPFFTKTLQHWPNIIRIGEYKSFSPQKTRKNGTPKSLDWKAGVHSKAKPFLQRDRSFVKKILKGVESKRPAEVQSAIIRRYLLEMTQSFLIPLERYMASLMPLQKNISPFKAPPVVEPFNPEDFLKTLETAGPQLTSGIKGDWPGLYKTFFRCPNFSAWYEARYKEVNLKLKAVHLAAMAEASLSDYVVDKAEVEVVDTVLTMKEKLRAVDTECIPLSDDTKFKLELLLQSIISTLPPDLHDVLKRK